MQMQARQFGDAPFIEKIVGIAHVREEFDAVFEVRVDEALRSQRIDPLWEGAVHVDHLHVFEIVGIARIEGGGVEAVDVDGLFGVPVAVGGDGFVGDGVRVDVAAGEIEVGKGCGGVAVQPSGDPGGVGEGAGGRAAAVKDADAAEMAGFGMGDNNVVQPGLHVPGIKGDFTHKILMQAGFTQGEVTKAHLFDKAGQQGASHRAERVKNHDSLHGKPCLCYIDGDAYHSV